MTESDKEMILDLVWEAMSVSCEYNVIPVKAELIADRIEEMLNALLSTDPQGTC
jgi:hypothetical protein